MNWNNPSFVRKVVYLVAIAVLLLPIAALSQPATAGRGQERSVGGKLAQLRAQYRLSQAELGEIDPASETMKLATLGLRGVAVTYLWFNAINYNKKKDFTGLELTVKQIIRLQPNFLKVWEYQAHNLSYNTSVEFDNYRDRYAWVKKGIDFLILGTHYNRDEPGMLYQLGWYVGHKIGRADESKQFRRMFKDDEDLHKKFRDQKVEVDGGLTGYDRKPDNWLVGKLWFDKAELAAEYKSIRTKSPLIFFSGGPMAAINAAAAMEKDDGIFGQHAQLAWSVGKSGWNRFGNRQLPTYLGIPVQLNSLEDLKDRVAKAEASLDALAGGARADIRAEKIAALPKRESEVLNKPVEKRSAEEQMVAVHYLNGKVKPSNDEVAARVPRERLAESREIADQLQRLTKEVELTSRYRSTVNFEYWRARCNAEQTQEALDAREQVHRADEFLVANKSLNDARTNYERAWDNWAIVFKNHPQLFDSIEAQELVDSVEHYADLLGRIEVKFPADFKLKELLNMSDKGQRLRKRLETLQAVAPETSSSKPEETKPDTSRKPADKPTESPPEKTKPGEKPDPDAKPPAKGEETKKPVADATAPPPK